MNPPTARRIYKSMWYFQAEIKEVLQAVFVAELLSPSDTFWIVSPWITNIPVIDNNGGGFSGLDPSWTARTISVVEVLQNLVSRGSDVIVVTRPDDHNNAFVARLTEDRILGSDGHLSVSRRAHLHEKGILGGHYHLSGSMNLTFRGVEVNEEAVIFETDPSHVAEARLEYRRRYGPSEG